MTVLLACIAGISLLVGGIGIMNIMYVSVTERTREIGLRMSIGAKGRHILFQFLIEAVIISVTGGIIGVVLGIGSSLIIKYAIGWPIYIQMYSVVLSFLVCTVTGIFFWLVSGTKGIPVKPNRCYTIRIDCRETRQLQVASFQITGSTELLP